MLDTSAKQGRSTRLALPAVGLGTRLLLDDVGARVVEEALAIGYRYIDTAPVYRNEAAIGRGVRASGIHREAIFVTTKVERDDLSAAHLPRSVERSLEALQFDYVDLLLIHWPNEQIALEETIAAMCALKSEGRLRHIGVANFPVQSLERAIEVAGQYSESIAVNQFECHPSLPQPGLIEACARRGVTPIAYSPMGREDLESEIVVDIAREVGRRPAQVTLRWHLQRGVLPIPIPDTATTVQIREQHELFDFELSTRQMQRLSGLTPPRRYFDPAWAPNWDSQD